MSKWQKIWSPSKKWWMFGLPLGALAAAVFGILFWGAFNWSMELTNTEEFCTSCHEMSQVVYQEYKNSSHYKNSMGVKATCPDCHVPKPWIHKVVRKIQATNELYHKVMGTIDTPEKFEAHRLELAQHVWKVMKETDSRECRNCHSFNDMDITAQSRSASKKHDPKRIAKTGETCIDCHKGIAHKLPEEDTAVTVSSDKK